MNVKANSDGNKKDELWDVQVSIARAAARLPKPSLAKLHYEVLEEIGQPPGLDLVDYFVDLTEINEEEVEDYFRFIGKLKEKQREEHSRDPGQKLADRIAGSDGRPTVLKFRQAFEREFNESPSEELTRYFLQKVQDTPRDKANKGDPQARFTLLAEKIAREPHPTVVRLRDAFKKQFGLPPSDEITQYFLQRIQKNSQAKKLPDEEFESKANFARTVANGLISTVLQFRKAYEKAYDEEPSTEIIEVFIQHLPRKNEEAGPK
ncbi:MAG TPA: hypothetical protein ENK96_10570 [Desulfobulbaceae bacterium]|nr:hypothetical protein [Desulfobulbaceae bacterium]